MGLLEWLLEPVNVSRTVTGGYLVLATCISLAVLAYALRTRDRNAVRLYVASIPIWMFIEGLGLVQGWRAYTEPVWLTYIVVAIMEDPGWVALAYMMGVKLIERRFPAMAASPR
jgi:hypothetical protein